jgi:hypothetical protein
MLKIRARWQGKCPKHPRYNPDKDGEVGIKGGCATCTVLLDVFHSWKKMEAFTRSFDSVVDAHRIHAGAVREVLRGAARG